ncbi:MAG TPA: hypothetical protein VL337_02990 [Acidimicrobiales bacterium]|jgi:hypothetical protein|nr:hypothetical protein [Acidimicrobiales bacterium]
MAATAVTVFVDDAVLGHLPPVCVRTGQPADLVIRTRRPVGGGGGGGGAIWLLVFLGPPGWMALFLLALVGPAGETLTVDLPYARAAWARERQVRRFRNALILAGVVCLALALMRPGPFPLLWVVLGLGSLLGGFLVWSFSYFDDVGIYLDASRRWVTLSRVHPAFARVVEAGNATAGPRR